MPEGVGSEGSPMKKIIIIGVILLALLSPRILPVNTYAPSLVQAYDGVLSGIWGTYSGGLGSSAIGKLMASSGSSSSSGAIPEPPGASAPSTGGGVQAVPLPQVQEQSQPAQQGGGNCESVIVVEGQTLTRIAVAHRTTWQDLTRINGLRNPNYLIPGQVIRTC